MTIYFPNNDTDYPAYNCAFSVDGDFSGYNTYRLELISRYNNETLNQSVVPVLWAYKIDLLMSNERYSEFRISIGPDAVNTGASFVSGYYDFKISGSVFNVSYADPYDPLDWNILLEGETKVKTKTTNDMQRSSATETIKYTTDPNIAQPYLIYK